MLVMIISVMKKISKFLANFLTVSFNYFNIFTAIVKKIIYQNPVDSFY